jgi:hypothetical protein
MSSKKANQEQKKKPFRKYGRKPEEENGIPMLRYGRSLISTSLDQRYQMWQQKSSGA